MAKGKYRVGGTKVIICKKGSVLNGKRGVLLGEKDVIFGRKCFAVKLRGGIYMVNRDYVKVAQEREHKVKSVSDVYSEIAKNNPPWTPEEEAAFTKRWFKRSKNKWVNEAMKRNIGLVFSIVNKYAFKKNDDIIQKAMIAMVDALRKYDPSKGVRVCTWITNPIRWAIYQTRNTYNKEGTIAEEISAKNHRYNLGISTVSIDSQIGNSDDDKCDTIGNTISLNNVSVDYISIRGLKSEYEKQHEDDIRSGIGELVANMDEILNSREIKVINSLMCGKNMVDISKEMKVTRMRISQIAKGAFEKIRKSKYGKQLEGLI